MNSQIGLALSTTSTSAVRETYSQGIIALIAISVAVLFPASLIGIYFIRKKCKKVNRDHRNSNTTSMFQTEVDNFVAHQLEDKLLDDINKGGQQDDKDPLTMGNGEDKDPITMRQEEDPLTMGVEEERDPLD